MLLEVCVRHVGQRPPCGFRCSGPTVVWRLARPEGARSTTVPTRRVALDSGTWPRMPSSERLGVVRRFLSLYVENEETIASIVTEEMGCPISLSRTFQAATPRLILESYLELAETYPFRSVRRASTGVALGTPEPVRDRAAVGPWDVPPSAAMR